MNKNKKKRSAVDDLKLDDGVAIESPSQKLCLRELKLFHSSDLIRHIISYVDTQDATCMLQSFGVTKHLIDTDIFALHHSMSQDEWIQADR